MRVLVDRQKDSLQAHMADLEVDEPLHARRDEQCRHGRPAAESHCDLPAQPPGDATALVRAEHDQIRRVTAETVQNRVDWIVRLIHLAHAQSKDTHRPPRALRREQAPVRERLPHLGKLLDAAFGLSLPRKVENRQPAPSRER